jgi:hypothetical protein
MALEPAYAVDGGKVWGRMHRRALWLSTGGGTGIVLPGDLRVKPRTPASGGVVISPGGGILRNDYVQDGGGGRQSYAVYNNSDLDVPIASTGSGGGRTDYVGIRITDPEYGGATPPDPPNALYSSEVVLSAIPTSYPFLPLAKIVQPVSNATITAGMITAIREMAAARTLTKMLPLASTVSTPETLTSTTGEYFPNAIAVRYFDIPSWATRVQIRAEWVAVRHPGPASGYCWVRWGPWTGSTWTYATQTFRWDTSASGGEDRRTWLCVDEMAVPASVRGTSQPFTLYARNDGTVTAGNRPQVDVSSGSNLELRFLETPDL